MCVGGERRFLKFAGKSFTAEGTKDEVVEMRIRMIRMIRMIRIRMIRMMMIIDGDHGREPQCHSVPLPDYPGAICTITLAS